MSPSSEPQARHRRWFWTVVVLGSVFSVLMLVRSQVAGDQLNMLARGWFLVADGEWIPYGLQTSAGGKAPGGLTALVTGLPMLAWQHHRAPTILILALQVLAYVVLDRLVSRLTGPGGRLLFAILYWLSPWRLYHSTFLWNPNFMLFFGALHFWSVNRQRHRSALWPSFVLVLAIGLPAQLHASAILLIPLSLVLWWRGYFKIDLRGAALGALVVAASLLPWLMAILQDPSLLPRGEGLLAPGGRPLSYLARGFGYWLRLDSLAISDSMYCLDFGPTFGPAAGRAMAPILPAIWWGLGLLTVPVALWANLRLWRRARGWWRRCQSRDSDRTWLKGVVRWSFLVTLVACFFSPTTPMSWQFVVFLHLAVMPSVLAVDALRRSSRRRLALRGTALYAGLTCALLLAMSLASPMYRCGGYRCEAMNVTHPILRSHHPMLEELGIQATCPFEVEVPGGWWPDVLPEAESVESEIRK